MTESQLRRAPSQQRAHDRIDRILDAADHLLAEEGAGALGTKQVAVAAGVSIGSLYHWFPDKESIAEALAIRYWDELSELVAEIAEHPVADPFEQVVQTLAAGFRDRPGFLAMWFSPLRTEQVREVTRHHRDTVAQSVQRIIAATRPGADAGTQAVVAQMLTLLGDGILREAFRLDRDGDPLILGEGAVVLRAYVQARLGDGT